ncbi:MAG: UDP-N-acetyl-D-mannosamine dehydrogenase [Desulfovibrio sp.]|nr:UDP-N-acetyl-D-mannosamine dehydrogenase [Desulfovibrio sp.]
MNTMTVSVFGLGYIGLPTATVIASRGVSVIGVDVTEHVVNSVNAGRLHIVEPGLGDILVDVVRKGQLRATMNPEPADAFLIAVPTPFKDGHKPDVSYIQAVAAAVAPVLQKGNIVILESTSPVGTTERLADWLAEARPDLSFPQQAGNDADVQIAYCPERVLPGKILKELVANDRVIGGMSEKASSLASDVYRIFVTGNLLVTNARTAEMCKLTENSFRDVNIAFANELSLICDKLDIDVWELIRLANRHPRVNILQPGCGVGGHCIAVDPWFIVDTTPDEARLIRTAREVNDFKPQWVLNKVKAAIADVLAKNPEKRMKDVSVVCLGLAFKPDIDDLRESPAVKLTNKIAELGCNVIAVEPNIDDLPFALATKNVHLSDLECSLNISDVTCLLVKHREFKKNIEFIKKKNQLIDVAGLY